jgi:iron complex transport system substrate-binding protein
MSLSRERWLAVLLALAVLSGAAVPTRAAPQRLITLLPSLTETVCALGECAHLVATDRYSNWPESVRALPKVGGFEDPQIELIVGLRPDVVLLAQEVRLAERLRQLGVRTLDVETQSYSDIRTSIATVAKLLGVPARAEALSAAIDHDVAEVVAESAHALHGRTPRVYYEVDSTPFGAGPRSFIGEMLARLDARNILPPELGPFPQLNPEYVVSHDPDVIFVDAAEAVRLARRPGWDRIRAVRERRVCSFAPEVRDTIVRPGPRVADGLRALARCLDREAP